MNRLLLLAFLLLFSAGLGAQETKTDADPAHFKLSPLPALNEELSASFFASNRERLRDTLRDSSMVIVFSAPVKAKSNDIFFPYHQDTDFYYFTGITHENAMLILLKNPMQIDGKWYRELLFIEDKDPKKELWSGRMMSEEEAAEASGVSAVFSNKAFKPMKFDWSGINRVYSNKHQFIEQDDISHPGDLMSLVKHLYFKTELAEKHVLVNEGEDLFAYLRQQKSEEELMMLQRAIDITCEAHNNAMRMIKPGMTEYQVEALINYTFRYNGAEGEAFPSIVAAGENGSIMHYTENDGLLIPGDLVIMDIGAQYEGYAADITRTIPISGTFSPEQAQVYQLVLDAQTVAIRYATKGYKFWTPHEEAFRTIGKGLIKLGIIKEWAEIGDYFTHGTSHYLGLDVHDAGIYSSLQPGEVITVEPGVYIPEGSPCDPKWWGIYVRIEDDILITDGPAKVLSSKTPKRIDEIEAMMRGEQASIRQ